MGAELEDGELNKVAFWEATGAGKTLLMHVNILQYLEYAGRAENRPDRIIVLTPNEGLSRQQENWGTSNVKLRAAHDFW